MKLIRNRVFETNSSSSHSITLDSSEFIIDLSLNPTEDGKLYIEPKYFGWEWIRYNDAYTKIQYLIADNRLDITKEVVKKRLKCDLILLEPAPEGRGIFYDGFGIDHESVGTTYNLKTEDDIDNFIFNKASSLLTGNDNSSCPLKLLDSNPNKKYKLEFKFDLDEFNKDKFSFHMSYLPNEDQLDQIFHSMFEEADYILVNQNGNNTLIRNTNRYDSNYNKFYLNSIKLDIDKKTGSVEFTTYAPNTDIIIGKFWITKL